MSRLRWQVAALLISSLVAIGLSPAQATNYSLTLSVAQTPSLTDPIVTLFGQLKPARKSVTISIQVQLEGLWQKSLLSTKTNSAGTWRIEAQATAQSASVKYRALASTPRKTTVSAARSIVVKPQPVMSEADPTVLIAQSGPGGRIHGMDISRWQHPNGAAIDFSRMYSAGVRFVMIKASDTKDVSDAQALKYLALDHDAAQAAGIYTGFYHYATLPDSTDPAVVSEDALAQAQKVIWRLASLGGYSARDLSYALDLENNCVRVATNGNCSKYTSRALVSLWAKTWLQAVAEKTGRAPIVYSYPQFLENAMTRSADFAQYPLWVAHYGINPADPLAQPGLKSAGCFVHSWTSANCSSLWTMWQYTSCGIAQKYGVSGTRVDLDVFRGTPDTFLKMMQGTWTPESADLMPVQEPSQTNVTTIVATSTDQPVTLSVDVLRPSALPVVTGTVKFVPDPMTPLPKESTQSARRASSGSWALTLTRVPAGAWSGTVVYSDISGTHATSSAPVTFTIVPGPAVTPTPTLTPSPSPTSKPTVAVDSCKNQIKN